MTRNDPTAEARVIGTLLLHPERLPDTAAVGITVGTFTKAAHVVTFKALTRAAADPSLNGNALVAVIRELERAADLDTAGGREGVVGLLDHALGGSGLLAVCNMLLDLERAREGDSEPVDDGLEVPTLSDAGNAQRFVRHHGRDLRWAPSWGAWLVWNGRRWERDETSEVIRRGKLTAITIYNEAANAVGEGERRAIAVHALRSESERSIRAMVALAQPDLAVMPSQLDADSWLLNCESGTIDLRNGELRPHRRADLITKLCPVRYDADAQHPAWRRFLERVVPDLEQRDFLQRAAGYSATADTSEEKLLFIHGPEATGKSTFLEAVKATLGDYAMTSDFEAFLKKRDSSGPRNDIARLAGARFVVSLEVDDGRRLAEGVLKALTGRDTVAARLLYRETFEFRPSFKLWLAANDKPAANANDGAMWRRIVLVPFEQKIPEPERDPTVKATLVGDPTARAAILAWIVAGARLWLEHGLAPPQAVRDATARYRAECDEVGEFVSECLADDADLAAGILRERYDAWCKSNGVRPMGSKRLATALRAAGWEDYKTSSGERRWRYGATAQPGASSHNSPRARAEGRVTETRAGDAVTPNGEVSDFVAGLGEASS